MKEKEHLEDWDLEGEQERDHNWNRCSGIFLCPMVIIFLVLMASLPKQECVGVWGFGSVSEASTCNVPHPVSEHWFKSLCFLFFFFLNQKIIYTERRRDRGTHELAPASMGS